jgi:CRP/FNR family transcriptional regulator, anaerobic regulatory protein
LTQDGADARKVRDRYPRLTLPPARPLPHGLKPGAQPCAACAARVLSVCDAVDVGDLHRLAALTKAREVEAHRTFIAAGEPADHLFNITEGAVKVYRLLPDGRQQVTGFLFQGDFLGLGPESTYAFSAESLTRVRYCRFGRDALYQFLEDFPKVERRLLDLTSNELAAAQEQMVLLGRKTAREKLASFLVMLLRRMARLGKRDDVIALPMTRLDIADYLGLTIETVSRTFTQFKKEGLIELPQIGRARLKSYAALVQLSEGLYRGPSPRR